MFTASWVLILSLKGSMNREFFLGVMMLTIAADLYCVY